MPCTLPAHATTETADECRPGTGARETPAAPQRLLVHRGWHGRRVHGARQPRRVPRDHVPPRAATVFESRRLTTTVLGDELSMPVIVAPTGLIRIAHRGGEVAAAAAAGTAETAIGVSTLSSYPIAEIAAATTGPVWYQVYFAGGREATELAIDRAAKAGCSALLVTVDLAAAAGRERRLARRCHPDPRRSEDGTAVRTRDDLPASLGARLRSRRSEDRGAERTADRRRPCRSRPRQHRRACGHRRPRGTTSTGFVLSSRERSR